MLTYIIRDIDGVETLFKEPLKVSYVSGEDAPADQLSVVFGVKGTVPKLSSVEMKNGSERLFFGMIDSQCEEYSESGTFLTIQARSLTGVLLDNEALPQMYCSPSMPLLMKRHFEPLGFKEYRGTDKAFNGELAISKGMSEWTVLRNFCRYFLNTEPYVDKYGVIDITGERKPDTMYLSGERILSCRHYLKNSALVSDIHVRARSSGGYEMPFVNKLAKESGIIRKRYVDSMTGSGRTVQSVKRMIRKYAAEYEQLIVECAGCFICATGTLLSVEGQRNNYRVREVNYTFDSSGERTKLYSEVNDI